MSWLPDSSAGRVVLVIEGRAGAAIRSVTLNMPDGSTVPTALSAAVGGFYISRLTAPAIGKLPGDLVVVGYDAAGKEIAHLSLQEVLAASTPH
jgi:hypothetical protein